MHDVADLRKHSRQRCRPTGGGRGRIVPAASRSWRMAAKSVTRWNTASNIGMSDAYSGSLPATATLSGAGGTRCRVKSGAPSRSPITCIGSGMAISVVRSNASPGRSGLKKRRWTASSRIDSLPRAVIEAGVKARLSTFRLAVCSGRWSTFSSILASLPNPTSPPPPPISVAIPSNAAWSSSPAPRPVTPPLSSSDDSTWGHRPRAVTSSWPETTQNPGDPSRPGCFQHGRLGTLRRRTSRTAGPSAAHRSRSRRSTSVTVVVARHHTTNTPGPPLGAGAITAVRSCSESRVRRRARRRR